MKYYQTHGSCVNLKYSIFSSLKNLYQKLKKKRQALFIKKHLSLIFMRKADIRNPLSLLAHERSHFVHSKWGIFILRSHP